MAIPDYYGGQPLPQTNTATGMAALRHEQEKAVRMPEIIAETQELGNDLDYLGKLVAELGGRLGSVLRMSEPQESGVEAKQPDPSSPLALELRGLRLRARDIAQHVHSLLSRCECG